MRAVWGFAVVLCACYRPSPEAGAPCGPDLPFPTGQSCAGGYCVSGIPDLDACTTSRCDGDTLLECSGSTVCPHGCGDTGGPHCLRLAPSNGLEVDWLDGATADLDLGRLELDTDTGEI